MPTEDTRWLVGSESEKAIDFLGLQVSLVLGCVCPETGPAPLDGCTRSVELHAEMTLRHLYIYIDMAVHTYLSHREAIQFLHAVTCDVLLIDWRPPDS